MVKIFFIDWSTHIVIEFYYLLKLIFIIINKKDMMKKKNFEKSTSWENVSEWYHKNVGKDGMYYHRTLVMPCTLDLLNLKENDSLLDIGCGQGILSRLIPPNVSYCGIDISNKLIKIAESQAISKKHSFLVGDATKKVELVKKDFTHCAIILAIQNMVSPESVFHQISSHLALNGRMVILMNHPYFRIPRMTSWGVDETKKIQYRRIDSYMSHHKIPIQAHPGQGEKSEVTYSFHFPLSDYFKWLYDAGFHVEVIEELCSDKKSTGSKAKMENRARSEFPLFLAIRAVKFR